MPAAEIAGLAIGTIALATLFSTCIELFDLVEVGRNCIYDYDLACTKISLLRERLRAWGTCLRVMEPGAEDDALRDQWSMKREIVGASLVGLRRILSDSDVLIQKYNLSMSSINLRRRTVWAIRDRAKFDRLIQDMSFLVEGLEKITRNDSSACMKEEMNEILTRRESISDWSPSPKPAIWNKSEITMVTTRYLEDANSRESNRPSREEKYCDAYQSSTNKQENAAYWREHVVSGTQRNYNRSIGIQGLVGQTGDALCIQGIQINSQNALGIQGVASPEAIAYLQQCAFARSSFPDANVG
jgi:hypothetical protein